MDFVFETHLLCVCFFFVLLVRLGVYLLSVCSFGSPKFLFFYVSPDVSGSLSSTYTTCHCSFFCFLTPHPVNYAIHGVTIIASEPANTKFKMVPI